jgi:hypothetical protein
VPHPDSPPDLDNDLAFGSILTQTAAEGRLGMFWRKTKPPQAIEPATPVPPVRQVSRSPETDIAQAILSYQRAFSDSLRRSVNTDVEKAKQLVAHASKIVGESGLGPALAPTLLDHVKYWPSWSKWDDFRQYVKFPAEDISGSEETDEAKRTKTSRVQFLYNGNPYGVVFVDEGMPRWTSDDHNAYGKVQLIYQSHVVLGLDVSQNLSKEHATWRWNNVFAFIPGTWMKELIEMAAQIEASQSQYFEDLVDNDALERARRIKF